jgi:hypothetical protein
MTIMTHPHDPDGATTPATTPAGESRIAARLRDMWT